MVSPEVHMKKQTWFSFVGSCLFVTVLPLGALAQVVTPPTAAVYGVSGPVIMATTEHVSLCSWSLAAINPSSYGPVTVTEEILDGVSGAVLAKKEITLPPVSATPVALDPCLEYAPLLTPVAGTAAVTTAPPGKLIVGVVLMAPQVSCSTCLSPIALPPAPVAASLNVYTLASATMPANIRTIPLHPAN